MTEGVLLLGGPYVSDFLRETVRANGVPALDLTDEAGSSLTAADARSRLQADPDLRVLTNSENTLDWVAENADETGLPRQIALFKDKLQTRELLRPLYPDFRFREIPTALLPSWQPADMPFPFVVKPAVGFFSLGVHMVRDRDHWQAVRRELATDLERAVGQYPTSVLDPARFIAEECIVGDEYAIDAWFDADGRAVISNILHHPFNSAADVGDRVYTTSVAIVTRWLHPFTEWLNRVGALAGCRNFPVHVEVRVRPDGVIVPIELNPLRFGGWCTTADLTWHSWGFNPYLMFLRGERPDWPLILRTRPDSLWSVVVLDNTTGAAGRDIGGFDYAGVESRFDKVLARRPVDWRQFPLFGFLFVETAVDHPEELAAILGSDLREFVVK